MSFFKIKRHDALRDICHSMFKEAGYTTTLEPRNVPNVLLGRAGRGKEVRDGDTKSSKG